MEYSMEFPSIHVFNWMELPFYKLEWIELFNWIWINIPYSINIFIVINRY